MSDSKKDEEGVEYYDVTIRVRRMPDEDHPSEWVWHDLLDGVVELLDVKDAPKEDLR